MIRTSKWGCAYDLYQRLIWKNIDTKNAQVILELMEYVEITSADLCLSNTEKELLMEMGISYLISEVGKFSENALNDNKELLKSKILNYLTSQKEKMSKTKANFITEESMKPREIDKLVTSKIGDIFLIQEVYDMIDALPDKKREIIYHYFGLRGFERMTTSQLAEKYSMTRQGIDILLKRTLCRIQMNFIVASIPYEEPVKKQSFIDSIIESHLSNKR